MNIETEIDSLAIKVNQKNKVTKFIISYAFKGAACAFVKWNLLKHILHKFLICTCFSNIQSNEGYTDMADGCFSTTE